MPVYRSGLVNNRARNYTPPVAGQVFVRESVLTLPANAADNDVLEMIPVEEGERVVGLQVFTEVALAGDGTIDVGDGGQVDRYIDGNAPGAEGGYAELGAGKAQNAANAIAMAHRYAEKDTIDVHVDVTAGGAAGAHPRARADRRELTMRVKAHIDTTLGGTTGHVIRLTRGQEKDVPDELGAQAVADGIAEDLDAPGNATVKEPAAPTGGAKDGAGADEGDRTVANLIRVMQATFEAGDPPADRLRSDGSPKFDTLRGNGADFPFTQAHFDEAWKAYREVNA